MTYDLFAHLYSKLENAYGNNQAALSNFLNRLKNNFRYEKDKTMAGAVRQNLGVEVDAGIAWSLGEILYADIDERVKRTGLDQDRRIRNMMASKPVWSKLNNQFRILNSLIRDTDAQREAEAALLPPLAFRMKIIVPLKSALVIKGDRPLVAHENPFCTEKVTGMPILRASTLKGQARQGTLDGLTVQNKTLERVDKIFGFANETKEDGYIARLSFFPAYLNKDITFDVIAPHDEKTRRVENPVCIEVVEPHEFTIWLQYWPLDLMNRWLSKGSEVSDTLYEDFIFILVGIVYWFQKGIGAKTSSGYGRVDIYDTTVEMFSAEGSPWMKLIESQKQNLLELLSKQNQNQYLIKWPEIWTAFESGRQAVKAEAPHE